MFNPNRLHAILEASSATRNGAARANKQYGGRDINLVLLIGGGMMQPQTVGGPEGGIGTGAQLTQVSRVGRGFYTVNTLGSDPRFSEQGIHVRVSFSGCGRYGGELYPCGLEG